MPRHAAALWAVAIVHICVTGAVAVRAGQQPTPPVPTTPPTIGGLPASHTGQDIFRATCAPCHGLDGKGMPRSSVGFDKELPDFTDCAFATAESDPDWHAVVNRGGRIRGLDRHMPSFGDALTPDDIASAVEYVRTFCTDRARWPQGDLNIPRAFFTEKAFPESETVWTTAFTGRGEQRVDNSVVYERRFGAKNQIEVVAPLEFIQNSTGDGWTKGLGDAAFAFKRAFYSSMRTGGIAAAGGEVTFPTGNAGTGLGNGYAIYEAFAMSDQLLPHKSFLQIHGGFEAPSDSAVSKEAYLRTAIGTTWQQDHGVGRAWSPQVEALWARPFGGPSEWDVVPQLQISLSKIQHVRLGVGARVPVSERQGRFTQGLVYFLWDWADGGLFEFWK